MKSDAYELHITSDKVSIKAADAKGFFYALQNIRLMLPPTIEGQEQVENAWKVPAVVIKDEPRLTIEALCWMYLVISCLRKMSFG